MSVKRDLRKIEKEIERNFRKYGGITDETEKWVIERKKFFIKLGFIAGGLILLLILSHLFLDVQGFR